MSKANKSPPSFEAGVREDGWRGLRLAVLCIVVGEYAKHNKLSNTVSDAEAICKAVNECVGCRAAIIRDPANTSTIRKLLRDDFLKPMAELPPEVVVIFVAGHGLQRGQHVYLIPIKAAIEDETDEEDRLSHLKVFEWLHKFLDSPAKTIYNYIKFVIIMDVYRVGIDAQSAPGSIADPEKGLSTEPWALWFSTSRGRVA